MRRKRYPLSKTARKLLSLMQDWGGECPVVIFPYVYGREQRLRDAFESLDGLDRNGLIEWRSGSTLGCITKKGEQALARGWR